MYPFLLYSPIGRYGLIEDNLFREDEIIECQEPVPEGIDYEQIHKDPVQQNALKAMYDSMPHYQFLTADQKT
jgi:hypothetical protein